MNTSRSPDYAQDRLRIWTLVLLALAALVTGYILGLLGGQPAGGSRAGWPPPANPRTFQP